MKKIISIFSLLFVFFTLSLLTTLFSRPAYADATCFTVTVTKLNVPSLPSPGDLLTVRVTATNSFCDYAVGNGYRMGVIFDVGGNSTFFSPPDRSWIFPNSVYPGGFMYQDFSVSVVAGNTCITTGSRVTAFGYVYDPNDFTRQSQAATVSESFGGIGATMRVYVVKPDGTPIPDYTPVSLSANGVYQYSQVTIGGYAYFYRLDCGVSHSISVTWNGQTISKSGISVAGSQSGDPFSNYFICNGSSRDVGLKFPAAPLPTPTLTPTLTPRVTPYCGDGTCDSGETCTNCSTDCETCPVDTATLTSVCSGTSPTLTASWNRGSGNTCEAKVLGRVIEHSVDTASECTGSWGPGSTLPDGMTIVSGNIFSLIVRKTGASDIQSSPATLVPACGGTPTPTPTQPCGSWGACGSCNYNRGGSSGDTCMGPDRNTKCVLRTESDCTTKCLLDNSCQGNAGGMSCYECQPPLGYCDVSSHTQSWEPLYEEGDQRNVPDGYFGCASQWDQDSYSAPHDFIQQDANNDEHLCRNYGQCGYWRAYRSGEDQCVCGGDAFPTMTFSNNNPAFGETINVEVSSFKDYDGCGGKSNCSLPNTVPRPVYLSIKDSSGAVIRSLRPTRKTTAWARTWTSGECTKGVGLGGDYTGDPVNGYRRYVWQFDNAITFNQLGTFTFDFYVQQTDWKCINPSRTITIRGPSILGNVFNDYNHNGSKDTTAPAETNYQGAQVKLYDALGRQVGTTQTTNANGNYAFTNVNVGTYAVLITIPNNLQATTYTQNCSPSTCKGPGTTYQVATITSLSQPNVTVNFGLTPFYSISGSVFVDNNKNGKRDGSPLEVNYTASTQEINITVPTTGQTFPLNTAANGTYTIPTLVSGLYYVSYRGDPTTHQIPQGYGLVYPSGSPPAFAIIVGRPGTNTPCRADTTPNRDSSCDANGNIINLNFAISNLYPWFQCIGGDCRSDNGINDRIPASASCGSYVSKPTTGNIPSNTPGVVFSGNVTAYMGQGQAGPNPDNWLVGNPTYPDVFNHQGVIKTSYAYYDGLIKQKGITATTLNQNYCGSGSISNCNLGTNSFGDLVSIPAGVYRANGNLTISSAYTFSSPNYYLILVNGDLTIKGNLLTQTGASNIFSVKGNITVDRSVGVTTSTTECIHYSGYYNGGCNLEGLFSTDKSFIIDGVGMAGCPGGNPDKRLNVGGTVVVNAGLTTGGVDNRRDLCAADLECPVFSVTERPDFLTSFPDILKQANFVWQEVAP